MQSKKMYWNLVARLAEMIDAEFSRVEAMYNLDLGDEFGYCQVEPRFGRLRP